MVLDDGSFWKFLFRRFLFRTTQALLFSGHDLQSACARLVEVVALGSCTTKSVVPRPKSQANASLRNS